MGNMGQRYEIFNVTSVFFLEEKGLSDVGIVVLYTTRFLLGPNIARQSKQIAAAQSDQTTGEGVEIISHNKNNHNNKQSN